MRAEKLKPGEDPHDAAVPGTEKFRKISERINEGRRKLKKSQ